MKLKIVGYYFLILVCLFVVVSLPIVLMQTPNPFPFKLPSLETPAQKQSNVQANNQRAQTATVLSIFPSNFATSLIALIPLAGTPAFLLIMWHTGLVVASYDPPKYWALTNPFAWIELSVYSFALLQSFRIFQFWRKRKTIKFWNLTLKTVLTTVTIAGTILFISAVWEYFYIH